MSAEEGTNLLETKSADDGCSGEGSPDGGWSSLRGILASITGALLVTTSRISVQALNRAIPDFQLNAMRCSLAMLCTSLYFMVYRISPRLEGFPILLSCLLVITGSLATLIEYVTVTFIPVASAHSILLTSALLSGLLSYTLIVKEKVTVDKMVAVPLCIAGIFLVTQPEFLFNNQKLQELQVQELQGTEGGTQDTNITNNSGNGTNRMTNSILNDSMQQTSSLFSDTTLLGYALAVCTGVLITFEITIIKLHQDYFTSNNTLIYVFWTYVLGAVASWIVMAIFESPQLPDNTKEYLLTGAHILVYVFIMPVWLYGASLISGNTFNIIQTTSIVVMLAAQYTILKDIHPGHRNWIEIVGVILVLVGSICSSVVDICRSYRYQKL